MAVLSFSLWFDRIFSYFIQNLSLDYWSLIPDISHHKSSLSETKDFFFFFFVSIISLPPPLANHWLLVSHYQLQSTVNTASPITNCWIDHCATITLPPTSCRSITWQHNCLPPFIAQNHPLLTTIRNHIFQQTPLNYLSHSHHAEPAAITYVPLPLMDKTYLDRSSWRRQSVWLVLQFWFNFYFCLVQTSNFSCSILSSILVQPFPTMV